MRTLSIDFNDAVADEQSIQSNDDLSWLGDLSPELTAKKSVRFITQTIIGLAIFAGFLAFSI